MKKARQTRYKVYCQSGLWYWRLRASNGHAVCDSARGYTSKSACIRSIWNLPQFLLECTGIDEVEYEGR